MASYRDRMNPEAIRFPSDLSFQVLIVSACTIDVFCAVAAVFSRGTIRDHAFDVIVVIILLVFKMCVWPREIVTDQFGVHSLGIFARINTHIPWREIGVVRLSVEVPGFGPRALGLRNDTLEFRSKDGKTVVVHTPHHSDRERLVREARLHGVTVDDSELP